MVVREFCAARNHCHALGPCCARRARCCTEASEWLHLSVCSKRQRVHQGAGACKWLQCLGSAALRFAQRRAAGYLGTGCCAARAARAQPVLHPAVKQLSGNALVTQCLRLRPALTGRSSGRAQGGFAALRPPLNSNVRCLVLSLFGVSGVFGSNRRLSGAPSAEVRHWCRVRALSERSCLFGALGSALANRTAAFGHASRLSFEWHHLWHRPRLSSRLPLTRRSSGRSKGCFAPFSPPLTSTLGPGTGSSVRTWRRRSVSSVAPPSVAVERNASKSSCWLRRAAASTLARTGA